MRIIQMIFGIPLPSPASMTDNLLSFCLQDVHKIDINFAVSSTCKIGKYYFYFYHGSYRAIN